MNYDKIYQDFVGKNKVQPLEIISDKAGGFYLTYKEGTNRDKVHCEDRRVLEEILVEFGGQNPETCKAHEMFLKIDGSWDNKTLESLGHSITKIRIIGNKTSDSEKYNIHLPDGTGELTISKKGKIKDYINILSRSHRRVEFTRVFKDTIEFKKLIDFLINDSSFNGMIWNVMQLCTESENKKQCNWKRVIAGDGTKRMVLELRELDGVPFSKCVRQDLFNAAGDMFDAPCQRIKVSKKESGEKNICLFAAEDGSVDLSNYEAAT